MSSAQTSFLQFCQTNQLEVDSELVELLEGCSACVSANEPGEPIAWVNDEFVEMVGWQRKEVLGQPCKFLQGEKTTKESRAEARRLIESKVEGFVLLVNYTKQGKEFDNALYIRPLYSKGQCRFFLGSQLEFHASRRPEILAATTPQIKSKLMGRRKNLGLGLKIERVTIAPAAAVAGGSCDDPSGMGDTYDVHECLGSGNFSFVYRAVHRSNNKQVALKVVRTFDQEIAALAKAEFSLLQRIQHPNIVRALDLAVFPDRVVLTLSFFGGDQLGSAVRKLPGKKLSETTAHGLFVALLQALHYLHQRQIVHRDVNSRNVLVSPGFTELLLIDFNIARHLGEDSVSSPVCGPCPSPSGGAPTAASDVWGAGLCLRMMLVGKDRATYQSGRPKAVSLASEPCMAVLEQCLQTEVSLRADTTTLLQTAWVLFGVTGEQAQKLFIDEGRNKSLPSPRTEAGAGSDGCFSEATDSGSSSAPPFSSEASNTSTALSLTPCTSCACDSSSRPRSP